jgi:hypothetical protein
MSAKLTHTELAFPDGIYQWVHTICYLHPIHISIGIYCEMYLCALMAIALFGTSFNYWRNPITPSLARNIDMFCAFTVVPYHYFLALYTTNKIICIGFGTTGILLYPLSIYIQQKHNYIRTAAICHCLLHICISLSASFIYQDYYAQGISLKWNL